MYPLSTTGPTRSPDSPVLTRVPKPATQTPPSAARSKSFSGAPAYFKTPPGELSKPPFPPGQREKGTSCYYGKFYKGILFGGVKSKFLKLKKALLVITGNFIKGYFLGG
jgi:hypothetical protein